jgi:hypothetical protein
VGRDVDARAAAHDDGRTAVARDRDVRFGRRRVANVQVVSPAVERVLEAGRVDPFEIRVPAFRYGRVGSFGASVDHRIARSVGVTRGVGYDRVIGKGWERGRAASGESADQAAQKELVPGAAR